MRGAREHNLKNVDVAFPRDRLVVITGLSGSGKSSLAFDTIYAEGQRRYVESLSAYARQFLGQMEKPDVDQIDGLSPAISIDQKGASQNPRSTVGTVTEIYDYLRLLFARIGHPHCPKCGREIERQTVSQIVDQVLAMPEGTRLLVLGPLIKDRKTEGDRVFEGARKQGFVRVRVDGEQYDLSDAPTLDRYKRHTIEVVVDRFVVRRAEAPEDWARDEAGRPIDPATGEAVPGSRRLAARRLDRDRPAAGRGRRRRRARAARRRVADVRRAAVQRALQLPVRRHHDRRARAAQLLVQLAARRLPHLHRPRDAAGHRPGPGHPGQVPEHQGRRAGALEQDADRDLVADEDHRGGLRVARLAASTSRSRTCPTRRSSTCSTRPRTRRSSSATATSAARTATSRRSRAWSPTSSGGSRRPSPSTSGPSSRSSWSRSRAPPARAGGCGPRSLAVTVDGRNISEVATLSVTDALDWAADARRAGHRARADDRPPGPQGDRRAARVPRRRRARLPDRSTGRAISLSGGEAQRIRLATQIGTTLMGVLYILDEPSIGLHQRDNAKLIATLTRLRDLGNTVLVVEHDEETIRTADWVIDIGPGAGEHGGEIIANGTLEAVLAEPRSITGAFLRGDRAGPDPGHAPAGQRQVAGGQGRPRAQPARHRRDVPARDVHRGHRRVGLGQEHARRRGPLPGAGPRPARARARPSARTTRSRASSTSTRSSRSTRARSAARRARTRPPTPACSARSGSCSPARPRPASAATSPAASASTSRAGAARTARATGSSRSRCSSCRTSTSRARSARASATTARRSRSTTRAGRSPTSSR